MEAGALVWAAVLLAGLVAIAVIAGTVAARLILDASRNGEPEPRAAPKPRARNGDVEVR